MTRNHRALHLALASSVGVLATAGASLLTACGADADRPLLDASTSLATSDASSAGSDAGALTPEGPGGADMSDDSTCFDLSDSDGDGRVDCEDDGCAETPICCVDRITAACCVDAVVDEPLALDACADGLVAECGGLGVDVRGATPRIRGGALIALTDGATDAIVDVPSWSIRPGAESITLEADITAADTSAQLDATGFGLWVPDVAQSVQPFVAIVVSPTRGEVTYWAGDHLLGSEPLSAIEPSTTYRLTLGADGSVSFTTASLAPVTTTVALPDTALVPLLFGRVVNDDDTVSRVTGFRRSTQRCDVPSALVTPRESLVGASELFDVETVREPSVVYRSLGEAPELRVAFAATQGLENAPDVIFTGTLDGPEDTSLDAIASLLTTEDVSTALDAHVVHLAGPDLSVSAGGVLQLHFAFQRADDPVWRLGRVDDPLGESGPRTIVELTIPSSTDSFDDPAVLDATRLVARRGTGLDSALVVLTSTGENTYAVESMVCDARACAAAEDLDASAFLTVSSDPMAFDRDEVRSPSVFTARGVTRIAYAGRRGTRWSLGLILANPRANAFRLEGSALLAPDGSFEADGWGLATPAAALVDDAVLYVYAGTDGTHWGLFTAHQPAP